MPNWVDNELHVKGKPEDVHELLDAVRGEERPFDFNKIIPYPEEFRAADAVAKVAWDAWEALPVETRPHYSTLPKDGFNAGGYEWCCENWGTKWNACNATVDRSALDAATEGAAGAWLSFDTAWSPPLSVVRALSEKFPTVQLTLKYWEGAMGFKGTYVVKGGNVKKEEESKYQGNRGG